MDVHGGFDRGVHGYAADPPDFRQRKDVCTGFGVEPNVSKILYGTGLSRNLGASIGVDSELPRAWSDVCHKVSIFEHGHGGLAV
jgi:hypothetical protein